MIRAVWITVPLLLAGLAHGTEPDVKTKSVMVGDAKVQIKTTAYPGSPLVFCHMHEDEKTSVEATLKVIAKTGGKLVDLVHSGERRVMFQFQGKPVTFDPNRIFTPKGILATVDSKEKGAAEIAAKFGEKLLAEYVTETTNVVIAVHNNTDGKFSIESFLPNGSESVNAQDVHVAKGHDADDFFYVTDDELFAAIKKKGYNVVLQNNARAVDDGSLSVYCARQGIPYVNVEAEVGHKDVQVKMLNDLMAIIELVKPKRNPVGK